MEFGWRDYRVSGPVWNERGLFFSFITPADCVDPCPCCNELSVHLSAAIVEEINNSSNIHYLDIERVDGGGAGGGEAFGNRGRLKDIVKDPEEGIIFRYYNGRKKAYTVTLSHEKWQELSHVRMPL